MSVAIPVKPYVRSTRFDKLIIIGSPFLAFLSVAVVSEPRMTSGHFLYNPNLPDWFMVVAILLTHSHIMLVFLRSHMNKDVFKRHPIRFIAIPMFMISAMWSSPMVFGALGVLALYWDEWHSLMQTFGFGRIYDSKLGNNPHAGRKLDMGMSFVVGLLPHALLLTYLPTEVRVGSLQEFMAIEPEVARKYGHYIHSLKLPLIIFGVGYTLFYVYSYLKLIKAGYRYSKEKLALFLSTGISAGLIAGFYSVADAAFFGNIYHALQYYFIVYVIEGEHLPGRLGSKKEKNGNTIFVYFMLFLMLAVLLAIARSKTESAFGFFGAFWLSSSLLHFWYDGFIWSVRKKDV